MGLIGEGAPAGTAGRWIRVARRLVGVAAAIGLVVAGVAVWQGSRQLSAYQLSVNPTYVLAALALLLPAFATGSVGWWLIQRGLGGGLPWRPAMRIWLVSQLGKYLPGGMVWCVAGRVVLAEEAGQNRLLVSLSMAVEFVLLLLGSALVAAWTLPLGLAPFSPLTLVGLAVATACGLHPAVFTRAVSLSLNMLGRRRLEARWSARFALGLTLYYTAHWCLNGLAFYLLVRAFDSQPLGSAPLLAGIYAAACFLGSVALIAPSGIGVREGALVALLQSQMPLPTALAVALAARLWYSIVEVGCGAVALGVTHFRSKREKPMVSGDGAEPEAAPSLDSPRP